MHYRDAHRNVIAGRHIEDHPNLPGNQVAAGNAQIHRRTARDKRRAIPITAAETASAAVNSGQRLANKRNALIRRDSHKL